jgi:hypothetical protein
MQESNEKVVVSDLFIEIYENFNVSSQVDKMMKLSDREILLLITLCLDKHVHEDSINSTVNNNLGITSQWCEESEKFVDKENDYIKSKVLEIYNLQNDKVTTNITINNLTKETGYKYIETRNICDRDGNYLKEPLNKDIVRDIRIDIITGV